MRSLGFQQSALLTVGTVINSLLGLVFYLLLARTLDVSGFGLFSFLLALGVLSAELGDLGVSAAIVKFGSGGNFPRTFTIGLVQRLLISLFLFFVFSIFSRTNQLLIYSAATGVSLLLVYLVTQSLIARQKYGWYIGTNILGNAFRLLLTAFLAIEGLLTVVSGLVVFSLASGFAALVGVMPLLAIFGRRIIALNNWREQFTKIFRFSRWLAISYGLTSLAAKIDTPLVYWLGGPVTAGVYSSAQKLTSVFPQIAAAIEGVFAPKFSRVAPQPSSPRDFRSYLTVATVLSFGCLALIPFSGFLIPWLLGTKYLSSIVIFQWLLVGLAIFFLSAPFATGVVYQSGKTQYHLGGSFLQLILTTILYLFLIPRFNVLGAAWGFVGSQIANFLYYLILWKRG